MARVRYSKAPIAAKLAAAGLAGPRTKDVIRAEMAALEERLRRLKKEFLRANSRESMRRLRTDPDFEAKRKAGCERMRQAPDYLEKRKEVGRRCPQPLRLPPMTSEQRRTYDKIRYKGKLPRGVALAAALGVSLVEGEGA